MGNFITIIIWIAIVYAIMKRAKKSSKPKAETPYENTSAKKQETVISQRLKEKYAPKPKKKAKTSNQRSYTGSTYNKPTHSTTSSDVLTRAKHNVAEDFSSQPSSVPPKEAASFYETPQSSSTSPMVFIEESEDLMKQVEDLMVLGYQSQLPYQRDFLAEGMELLNNRKFYS